MLVKQLVSAGNDLCWKNTLLLDGRVELSFLFHLYTNPPKLQAKHENVTVTLGRTITAFGGTIICGQGTVKQHT